MMMGLWFGRRFGGRALLRLGALTALSLCAARPAAARTHPAPIHAPGERRVLALHPAPLRPARSRRAAAQADTDKAPRKAAPHKPIGKEKGAPGPSARQAPARSSRNSTRKPALKPKHHKLRPEDEADNDPLPLHRIAVPKPAARQPQPKKLMAAGPPPSAKKTLTSGDFLRAAGVSPADVAARLAPPAPAAETFEQGESHPDDDERLPVKRDPAKDVTAMVSAAPDLPTPAGRPTLPEKLQALAANAGSAVKADASAAKNVLTKTEANPSPSALPVDKADRDAIIEQAMTPTVLPVMYRRNGHLIVPPPMKGTHEILVHQNLMADTAGLDRIQDDEDLDRLRMAHLLVALPASRSLEVNGELPVNRRYARPWAAQFAADTAKGYYTEFHQPLRLNSAVRTVQYQRRLQRVNGNAAGINGDDASPHLTGQAMDFGKRGMSIAQIAWMRSYLAPLMQAGKIDVEEEFHQACFHISVYRSYLPIVKTRVSAKMQVAAAKHASPVAESTDSLRE